MSDEFERRKRKSSIEEIFEQAKHIKREAQYHEGWVRGADKQLADKVKKLGDAAQEVVKHVEERKGPTTG